MVILTLAAAVWLARQVESAAQIHGLVLGVIVGAPSLIFSRPLSWAALATLILTIGAGWLGSAIGRRIKQMLTNRRSANEK